MISMCKVKYSILSKGLATCLSYLILVATFPVPVFAQETFSQLNDETATMLKEGKYTVAVLDFEGRGISQLEAATLTDRLTSELAGTNTVILIERGQMQEILDEQGFQQSGCTTAECAAEVGAMLGVQKMISGSFGKIGNSYTIDVKMFSVETGATEKSIGKTYKGEIDGLITEIEVLAWEIVGLTPPDHILAKQQAGQPVAAKPKKEGGGFGKLLLWTTLLAGAGGGAYYALVLLPGEEAAALPEPPVLP